MPAQNPIATIWNRLRHPVDTIRSNIREGANEWRQHPIQEGLQRLIGFGAGAATANPALGSAAGSAADRFFSWWNNRGNNDFGPGSGMPGITSPYTGSQSTMGAALGIPDYLNGAIPQGQPENPEQPTDPNEHPSQRRPYDATITPIGQQAPQPPANYGAGWRTGEGGSGLGGGWSTVSGNRLQALFGDLGSSGTGSLAGDGQALLPRFQNEFGRARQNGSDAGEMAIRPSGGPIKTPLSAQQFILNNPEAWARMQQEMRTRS